MKLFFLSFSVFIQGRSVIHNINNGKSACLQAVNDPKFWAFFNLKTGTFFSFTPRKHKKELLYFCPELATACYPALYKAHILPSSFQKSICSNTLCVKITLLDCERVLSKHLLVVQKKKLWTLKECYYNSYRCIIRNFLMLTQNIMFYEYFRNSFAKYPPLDKSGFVFRGWLKAWKTSLQITVDSVTAASQNWFSSYNTSFPIIRNLILVRTWENRYIF